MTLKKKIILAILSAIFLALLGITFRVEISDIFLNISEKKSANFFEKQGGVARKTSYIGRIKEAKKLINHQYYQLATKELTEAIREKPQLLNPYLLLGEIHLQQENTPQLENLIKTLDEKFPKRAEVTTLKVRNLIAQRKFNEATTFFPKEKSDLESGTFSPNLEFYHALLISLQNNHEKAYEILRILEQLPISQTELIVSKEGVKEETTNTDKISVDADFSEKIKNIAIIYEEFKEFSDGKSPHLFALIAKSLAENNEFHLAREFADVAIQEDIEYIDAWVLRGYSEFLLQNYDTAILDLRRAYELDPIRPETHYFLALTLQKLGKDSEAALFFEKALENDFEFSNEIQWKLIEIFTKQQKYEKVIELYRKVIEQNPNPNEFVPVIHTSIDILKKPEVAVEISEKLLEENPTDVLAMNLYGWALIANKEYGQAQTILDDALELDEKNPRIFLNLGLLAEKQEKFTKAIDFYKQSYELGKEQPFNSVTNLAAERYNQLIEMDRPEEQEASTRKANSP